MKTLPLICVLITFAFLLLFPCCVSEEKPKEQAKTTSTLAKETLKLANTTEMPTTTEIATTTTAPSKKPDDIRTRCIEETGEKNLDACMAAYSVQGKDAETCGRVSSEEYRNMCYFYLGKKTKNSEDCSRITDADNRLMCLSIVEQNPSGCDSIISERIREDCRIESVPYKKDASVCERKGTVNYRNNCLKKYAVTYNNASACDPIDNAVLRDDCYMLVAKENNNVGACLKVFIQDSEWCVIDVATELKDKSICEKLSKENDAYFWCLASLEKDQRQCDKMKAGSGQDYCRVYVAKALKDKSLCGRIGLKEACYGALASEEGDLTLCANIESPSSEYVCYIFAKKSEAGMCSKIRPRMSVEWYKDLSRSCDQMAKDGNTADGIALCRADADKYKDSEMGDKKRDDTIKDCFDQLIAGIEY